MKKCMLIRKVYVKVRVCVNLLVNEISKNEIQQDIEGTRLRGKGYALGLVS